MNDWIFLLLFIVIFFPLLLLNFQRIYKAQKETIELLQQIKRILGEKGEKE